MGLRKMREDKSSLLVFHYSNFSFSSPKRILKTVLA